MMLDMARAKGWTSIDFTGSEDFKQRAARAALEAGIPLVDQALAQQVRQAMAREHTAAQAARLDQAESLARWMRAHPRQAKIQRLSGGRVPGWGVPGIDRQALAGLWPLADAWTAGRWGTAAERDRWQQHADPLLVEACKAGRESAYNALAQKGLTVQVGAGPAGGAGLVWRLPGAVTRESVERYAGLIQDRQKRAGVEDHAVGVVFGPMVRKTDKICVLEHLLRQSVAVDRAALLKAGEQRVLESAQKRLTTHKADGTPQAWHAQKLEQEQLAKKQRAAKKKQAAQEKRIAEAREALEAEVQKRAEEAGYQAEMAQWSQVQRAADPEHQWLVRETGDDLLLQEMAHVAYQQGKARAQQVAEQAQKQRAAVARAAIEKDIQHRAADVGYRDEIERWDAKRRADDPERQRLARDLEDDPLLTAMASAAYQQGRDRGVERLKQRERVAAKPQPESPPPPPVRPRAARKQGKDDEFDLDF